MEGQPGVKGKGISRSHFLIIGVLVILIMMAKIASLYTDYLWFFALGFQDIFTITLWSKIALFAVGTVAFFAIVLVNLLIARHFHKSGISLKAKIVTVAVLSLVVGVFSSRAWLTVQQYLNQVPFGVNDPIFGKDVAFYVFSLPFYMAVWRFLYSAMIMTTLIIALYYFQQVIAGLFQRRIDPNTNMQLPPLNIRSHFAKIKRAGMVHIAVLASLIFVLFSIKHYFEMFSVMYSESGIVVGAGYTDVMVFLPVVKILMVVSLVIAALFIVWIFYFSKDAKLKKRHVVLFILILYFLFAFVGKTLVPGIVQALIVSPNEFNLEQPYIENNIRFTRMAYGLDAVEEEDFAVRQEITPELLDMSSATMDNIRILDWRPLTKTYQQTQEIRLYYDLSSVDIDRYDIGGKYTQVMLSPRELDQNQIAENARTWVNLHMIYSHGFGVVVSPVNKVTKQGLPEYLVKDIPPVYTVDDDVLRVDQPRIYYGEKDNRFILVNTGTNEFDYPKGNSNEYINYDGKGGVVLDTFMKKLMMAFRFKDIKILLSNDITPESKILFKRHIRDRIGYLTPFLDLDYDPYMVISDGRMYWIQDAYTKTGNYPYSQKSGDWLSSFNYIRNPVKIVVDAYDGTVTYYVVDTKDPLMQVYANIFPSQFRLFRDMPEGLRSHIRYPEELFIAQSEIYSTYHMDDPNVFYNKEDAWQIPYEVYGTGDKVKVEPYYIILELPGESEEEFVLMTTFTPIRKDNMISWLAARSDGENYGKLLLYKFPKDKLVYGPLQIEARIDQDSEISQQLTLWSQQGSRVTRGNLLVIPIDNSLLYIEPLYIQAETGQLPELKRVLVSDGERVVMEPSLGDALEALFGKTKTPRTRIDAETNETITIDYTNTELIDQANEHYEDILAAMQAGDWTTFGQSFDELGAVLEELKGK